MTTTTTPELTLSDDPNDNAARIKAQQSAARKAAKEAAAAAKTPATARTSKSVKVGTTAPATSKAPKVKAAPKVRTAKDGGPTKAQQVRALLDQGKSVREVAQSMAPTWAVTERAAWSYAWDVARAYEDTLKQPGRFIASRPPGYVKEAKAPVAIDQTPRPKGKRPAKVAEAANDSVA